MRTQAKSHTFPFLFFTQHENKIQESKVTAQSSDMIYRYQYNNNFQFPIKEQLKLL